MSSAKSNRNYDLNMVSSDLKLFVSLLLSLVEVLLSSGFLLSCKLLGLYLLGLGLVNCFNEHSLILELVSLRSQVKLVVQGSINLL